MLFSFLAVGGILFWGFVGLITLILASQVSQEKAGQATLTFLGGIVILVLFSNLPIVATIKAHPIYVVYGLLSYLGIAAVWATIKWRAFYLPALFDRYDAIRTEFLKTAGPNGDALKDFPADPKVRDRFNNVREVQILNIQVNRMVRYNKARITTWMVYWPFSIIGSFFGDFLSRVFTTIYKTIAGMLQAMSDRMASKYSELT